MTFLLAIEVFGLSLPVHKTAPIMHHVGTAVHSVVTAAAPPAEPDWASQLTARSTFALAVLTLFLTGGVAFAAAQFFLDRKFNRTLETDSLLRELKETGLWEGRSRLDSDEPVVENRARANLLYYGVERFGRFKAFRKLNDRTHDFIEEVARLAERIEIYIRKGVADEGIIVEHAGYDLLSLYQFLRDILQERAAESDTNYEGFRDLALRIQDYAKLYPLDADLRDELVWDPLPVIHYKGGDESLGYDMPWWSVRRLRLAIARWRYKPESSTDEPETP